MKVAQAALNTYSVQANFKRFFIRASSEEEAKLLAYRRVCRETLNIKKRVERATKTQKATTVYTVSIVNNCRKVA